MFEEVSYSDNDMPNEYSMKEVILECILNEAQNGNNVIDTGRQTGIYPGNIVTYPLLPFDVVVDKRRITTQNGFSVLIDKQSLLGASSIGSSLPSGKINVKDVRTFPHDFTFQPISSETDIKINSILSGVTTPLSYLSPDYIGYYKGDLIVIEFATTQNDASLRNVLNRKLDKYFIPLREAVQQYQRITNSPLKAHLCIIVVSDSRVASTHKIPQDHVNELIYRYKLSSSIQNHAYHELGIEKEESGESEDIDKLKMLFRTIPVSDLGGEFSLENYHRILSGVSEDDEAEMVSKIFREANKKMGKKVKEYETIYKPSMKAENPNVKICLSKYLDYLNEADQEGELAGLRSDMKAMVQVPFISMRKTVDVSFSRLIRMNPLPSNDSADTTLNLLRSILIKIDNNDIYIPEDSELQQHVIDDLLEFSQGGDLSVMEDHILRHPEIYSRKSMEQVENRSKYHRVIVELSKAEQVDMAKYGIGGKQFKDDPNVSLHRSEKRRFFNPKTTSTSDLDKLLESHDLIKDLFSTHNELSSVDLTMKKLIFTSLEEHSNPSNLLISSSDYFDEIMMSKIGSFSSMISDIGIELAISIKQNCKSKEYIVKRLRNYNLWMVIKPTRSSSHIFFSLFTYSSEINSFRDEKVVGIMAPVFKTMKKAEGFYYSDFISLNMSKIVNWVLCESRLYATYAFWLNAYGCPIKVNGEGHENIYSKQILASQQMTILSVIINLIDKAEVEEHMSMLRYITLEGLTSPPNLPKPYKMFSKFSKQLRSRFTIWVIRKLYIYAREISGGQISLELEKIDDVATNTANRKHWRGFMNPYLNQLIDSPQLMINLFYLGYLKNKDEYPENNTLTKLYEKILVIEDEFSEDVKTRIGIRDKEWGSDEKHTYNITLIKIATDHVKSNLIQSNPNMMRDLENLILTTLASTNLDPTFTTLKASSSFNDEMFPLKAVNSRYSRMKVVEALSKKICEPTYKLIDILPDACQEVFSRKYLLIDIFQKNQHGGLREIYVLGLFDRIIQYVIESISRMICSSFPGETMTHPRNKKMIPESHHSRARQRFSSSYLTFGLSADASKWSQNHYAHKFSIFLIRFTPKYMHGFIWSSLNLWRDKRIMLNPKLIEILDNPNINGFYSPSMQSLYEAYHGRKSLSWYQQGTSYIKTRTGMMQGILHYASSLLHSILNEYSKSITIRLMGTMIGRDKPPEVDMLQSSDDSAMLFSIGIDDNIKSPKKACILAALAQEIKSLIGRECSIIDSIKTTSTSMFFHEFNSEFKFGSNHYRPDIKFMISLPLISEQEAMIARQEEWSTLLTQYIENGGSTWPVHIGQISQALIHYRLMGSSVNKLFDSFQHTILVVRDPSQGYFLMDPLMSAGLLGFKYNLWNACRETALGKIYKHHLFKSTSLDSDKIEVTSSGSISRTIKLIYGDRKKWTKMMERLVVREDWKSAFNEDPQPLYVGVRSYSDLINMISMKLNTSGVVESIAKGNVISRTIASSVYLLSFQCLSKMKDWQKDNEDERVKYSLFDIIQQSIKVLASSEESLTEEELRTIFPFHEDFKSIQHILKGLQTVSLRPGLKDYRRRITDIEVASSVKITNMPLKEILSQVWYPGVKSSYLSHRSAEVLFQEYQDKIPWLNHNPKTTMDLSPFDDSVSLYNWVSSVSVKERVVRLLGTPIVSYHGKSNLLSALLLNFQTDFKLEAADDFKIEDSKTNLKHLLFMISRSPFSDRRSKQLLSDALSCPNFQLDFNKSYRRSRDNSLAIIQKTLMGESIASISDCISDNRMGVIGGFVKRGSPKRVATESGHKISYTGDAIWEGKIHGVGVRIKSSAIREQSESTNYTGMLNLIEVDDLSQFLYVSTDVLNLCREMGLQISHRDIVKLPKYCTHGLSSNGLSVSYGIPIYSSSTRIKFSIEGIHDLDVETTRNIIRLKATMRGWNQQKITLISYSIKESDFQEGAYISDPIFEDSIDEAVRPQTLAWLSNTPIPSSSAVSLMDNISGVYDRGLEAATADEMHRAKVLREVLIATLMRKGINQTKGDHIFSFAATKLEIEDTPDMSAINDVYVDDNWADEFDFEIGSDSLDASESGDNIFDIETMLEDERYDIEQLISVLEPGSSITYDDSSMFRRHNLLNNCVEEILRKFALENVSICFNQARVSQTTVSLRSLVAVFVGIPTNQVVVDGPDSAPSNLNVNFD